MDSESLIKAYTPPGPVSRAFIQDVGSMFPMIMGPVGSGKTTACIFKRLAHAMRQPTCRDGVKRCKGVVLRSDYRTLEKTLLESWRQWFPKGFPASEQQGGNDRPVTHTLNLAYAGHRLEIITEFRGIGDQRAEDVLRGYEGSFGWVNEADLVHEEVVRLLIQRVAAGRYPSAALLPDGVKPVGQVIGDMNAPDMDNWTYDAFVERPRPGWKLWRQPSGLSPQAENRQRLSDGYYEAMAAGNPDWWVRRYVHAEFGYSRDGTPVYPEFSEARHVAPSDLKVDPGLPLVIGLDAGMVPAAVMGQPTPAGQMRIVDELVPGHGFGPRRFGQMLAEWLAAYAPTVRDVSLYADPASDQGADREGGDMSWMDMVSQAVELPIRIAGDGSNEIALRLEGVRDLLTGSVDGHTPRLWVSPRARKLVKGFASDYRYRRQKEGAREFQAKPMPDKENRPYPDVHDALQYLVLGWRGRSGVMQRRQERESEGRGGWGRPGAARGRGFDVFRMGR